MADEIIPNVVTEPAEPVPAMKKQRAPRREKADIEAASSVVNSSRGRKKRAENVAAASSDNAPAKRGRPIASTKPASAKRGPKSTSQSASALSSASDEMADILQLEEENKRLRRDLAEKLRAENADLRRRLGIK